MAAQHNASMELIPGMDKLLNHMKEQDKKIKELQDEIKSYWKVDDETGGFVCGTFPDIASHHRECFAEWDYMRERYVQRNREANELKKELKHKNEKFCEWIEENKKLKEENKILINYQTSIAEIEKWSDGELEDIVDVLPQLKKLKAENKKLKESLEENEKEVSLINSEEMENEEKISRLEVKIEELKEWSLSTQMIEDTSAETIEEFERDVRDNWEENTEFTEENEKLKDKITCLESDSHNEVSLAEQEEQMENTLASLNFYKECNEELKDENKKLKKEHIQNIMKTKSIATELYREVKYSLGYGEFDEPDRKVMYDDIKELKKTITRLQKERNYLEVQYGIGDAGDD